MDDYSEQGTGDGHGRPASIFSKSSEDRTLILQEIYGRTINNTNEFYMLPADVPEHNRLDLQHEILKEKFGGLYPREVAVEVQRLMSRPRTEGGPPPTAIDVGTGSGSWAIEMARLFPNAEITGVDLVPVNSTGEIPANCRFECGDANLGLGHYGGPFEIVHARNLGPGISSYKEFIKEAWNILRPGGLLLTGDGYLGVFDQNTNPITATDENHPNFSWMQVMMLSAREALIKKGANTEVGSKVFGWIDEMGDIWENKGHFTSYIPVGPWEDSATPKERFVGELMRQNSLKFVGAVKPLLLSSGIPQETVDHWHSMVEDELKNGRTKTYTRWTYCWAFKAPQETSINN